MKNRGKFLFGLVLLIVLLVFPTLCLGKDFFTELEIVIGQMVGSEIEKEFALSQNPALNARVKNIGLKLTQAGYTKRKGIDYQFKVLATSEINAFAAPGGFIYITEGLLRNFGPSDDEIAFVLSHEITHVREQHGTKRILPLIIIGKLTEGDTAKEMVGQLLISGRSREDEKEADAKGSKLSKEAGYDPAGALAAMRRLETLHKKKPDILERLFATHPPTSQRAETIKDFLIKTATGSTYKAKVAELIPTVDSFVKPTDSFIPSPKSKFGDEWLKKCSDNVWMKHCGVDVDLNQKEKEVYASGDGIVRYAGSFGKGWGECVILEHQVPGIGPVTTLYGHIIISEEIKPSVIVSKGQMLGKIDSKINPPHLHFGVRLEPYKSNLSIKGALFACENPEHLPKFPEKFTDPIQFLERYSPPQTPQPRLQPRDKILLEKGPRHLGDDTKDSKVIWFKEFELNEEDLTNRKEVVVKLRVMGTPHKDPVISFNRQKVGYAVTKQGKWEWFEFTFDPEILKPGKNLIDIETLIPNIYETFDDCEFADVYLLLK